MLLRPLYRVITEVSPLIFESSGFVRCSRARRALGRCNGRRRDFPWPSHTAQELSCSDRNEVRSDALRPRPLRRCVWPCSGPLRMPGESSFSEKTGSNTRDRGDRLRGPRGGRGGRAKGRGRAEVQTKFSCSWLRKGFPQGLPSGPMR